MIGKLLGAYIGNKIDRRDGQGGLKGALAGMVTAGVLRRAGPMGLAAVGGLYVAKKLMENRRVKR